MYRSPHNLLNTRQPSSNVDNYKVPNELIRKPTSPRTSHPSPPNVDNYKVPYEQIRKPTSPRTSHPSPPNVDNYKLPNELIRKPPNARTSHPSPPNVDNYKVPHEQIRKPISPRTSRQSPTTQNDEWDNSDRTLRRLITDQPLNPSLSRSSSNLSLKSMIIEGQWKFRGSDDDHLRLKSMGIENLVTICHDIMSKTFESTNRQQHTRIKSSLTNQSWPLVKLDEFKRLTNTNRDSLRRAQILNLMTIVYEAASTSASISQLIRIWREASEHNLHPRRSKSSQYQPLISYEKAFQHLIRTPDNQLLQIALHASLISTHKRSDLQRLGEKLGIKRNQFDMGSIRDSTKAFQNLIKFLHEQRLIHKHEQKYVDTNRLPYKPKKKRGLHINVSGTKFSIICQAADIYGFSISPNSDFTCNLLWNDIFISMNIVSALKPYQKVNHFPTMNEVYPEDLLTKNFDRLSHLFPDQYNFVPKTWILPNEYNLWYSYASNKPKKDPSVYIIKPINEAMGRQGIEIHCDYKQIEPIDNYIIQEYIREPYLIDGFKFDIRIYALITSCDPLRVFIFNNGLIRMSTKKYQIPNQKNSHNLHMHLTNYLMNEENIDDDIDTSHEKKRSLKYLFEYLKKQNKDVDVLWKEIQNIVLKTVFLAEPDILHAYRMCRPGSLASSESVCFELLSFNILIDKNLKPWIIEVNRCPNFDINEQIDFDVKIKLLFDTFDLLRFRISDRKKSLAIEKAEAQRRLYANLGKFNKHENKLIELKEHLYLIRREKSREIFENRHLGGFIRLFPVEDDIRMNKLMNILIKSFQVLHRNKHDLSWDMKYYNRHKEEELLDQIGQLEDHQHHQQENRRLTYGSNSSLGLDYTSPSTSFVFESSDDDHETRSRSSHSDSSRKSTLSINDSFMKKFSTQTPLNILQSTSLSSLNIPKQRRSNSLISTGNISRPEAESHKTPPGVSANRITEKKNYSILTPENSERKPSPLPKHKKRSNDKFQMVTYSSIIQATRKQQIIDRSLSTNITKELQLTHNDLNHLYQLIFEEMNKLFIHYPNKSDKETYEIYIEIIENWNEYKSDIGRFWLIELDTNKRQSIIEIVWNNIRQIIKKFCIIDEFIQELPLNRHLIKLEQRLLGNNGHCLWDICQNRHNSWESLFIKSTNNLSSIELDCCYRFVELCKQALFIVYQYSIDEKIHKQKQTDRRRKMMIKS